MMLTFIIKAGGLCEGGAPSEGLMDVQTREGARVTRSGGIKKHNWHRVSSREEGRAAALIPTAMATQASCQ